MGLCFDDQGTQPATTDPELLDALLDSLEHSLLLADTEHVIRYMNRAAIAHYKQGQALLGTSLLDCHNETSQRVMLEVYDALRRGEDERLITDSDKHRIFMRAARDASGELIGYYERYEPPSR